MSEVLQIRVHGNGSRRRWSIFPACMAIGRSSAVFAPRWAIVFGLSNSPIHARSPGRWKIIRMPSKARLLAEGIDKGWLLAESWGSQPAWALVGRNLKTAASRFQVKGLILAGGFVKHPFGWGPGLLGWIGAHMPMGFYRSATTVLCRVFKIAAPRTGPGRRTALMNLWPVGPALDREAMLHRLDLSWPHAIPAPLPGKPASRCIISRAWWIRSCRGPWSAGGCGTTAPPIAAAKRSGWRIITCWRPHQQRRRTWWCNGSRSGACEGAADAFNGRISRAFTGRRYGCCNWSICHWNMLRSIWSSAADRPVLRVSAEKAVSQISSAGR